MTVSGVSDEAEATARRAKNSTTFRRLVKAGLIAFGITHLLLAWLALQIAWGRAPESGDHSGAFATVAAGPGGRFLVILIAIALAALALWQAFEAAFGSTEPSGRRDVWERVVSVARALIYGVLAWSAYRTGTGEQSSGGKKETASAELMSSGGGRFLIGLIGLVIIGVGIGLIWYGWKEKFLRNLYACPRWARTLGKVGYPSKGVALGLVGGLTLAAALSYDPEKARGLDAALRLTANQSYGRALLTIVALGVIAYGIYCFAQARYRKI